jgi:hypothetical protein
MPELRDLPPPDYEGTRALLKSWGLVVTQAAEAIGVNVCLNCQDSVTREKWLSREKSGESHFHRGSSGLFSFFNFWNVFNAVSALLVSPFLW